MAEWFSMERVETWEGFLSLSDSMKGDHFFRGMGDSTWDLKTTLERYVPNGTERELLEGQLLFEFQGRAGNFVAGDYLPHPQDDPAWLALMQHHGAPTRLLDFTKSPYVAAFFAFEELGEGDRAVWTVDRHASYELTGRVVEDAEPSGSGGWFRGVDTATRLRVGKTPWPGLATVPVDLHRISGRIAAQQGVFLWPNEVGHSFMANLAPLGSVCVRKLVLPNAMRGRALEDLRSMNITMTTLFPGLDGFARSLRTGFVEEDKQSKILRRALTTLAHRRQV